MLRKISSLKLKQKFILSFDLVIILIAFFIILFLILNLALSNRTLHAEKLKTGNLELVSAIFEGNNESKNASFVKNVESSIISKDKRIIVLDAYFKNYNSPLFGHGKTFVNACDYYAAPEDCIVVAAIAKHETNLCNYIYSAEMFNCWGFGGGEQYRQRFNSFEESIFKVTQVLVQEYGERYMNDPALMERTFCGVEDPLCEGWGFRVKSIMYEINEFSKSLGMGDLMSLRR